MVGENEIGAFKGTLAPKGSTVDAALDRVDANQAIISKELPKLKQDVSNEITGAESLKASLAKQAQDIQDSRAELQQEIPVGVESSPEIPETSVASIQAEVHKSTPFEDVVKLNPNWDNLKQEDKQQILQQYAQHVLNKDEEFLSKPKEQQQKEVQDLYNAYVAPKSTSDITDWITAKDNPAGQFVRGLAKAGSIVTRPFDPQGNQYYATHQEDSIPYALGQGVGVAGEIGSVAAALAAPAIGATGAALAYGSAAAVNVLQGIEDVALDHVDPLKTSLSTIVNTAAQGFSAAQPFFKALGIGILGGIISSFIQTGQVTLKEIATQGLTAGLVQAIFHTAGKLSVEQRAQLVNEVINAKKVEPDFAQVNAEIAQAEQQARLRVMIDMDAKSDIFVKKSIELLNNPYEKITVPDASGKVQTFEKEILPGDPRYIRAKAAVEWRAHQEEQHIEKVLLKLREIQNQDRVTLGHVLQTEAIIKEDLEPRLKLLREIGGSDSDAGVRIAELRAIYGDLKERYETQQTEVKTETTVKAKQDVENTKNQNRLNQLEVEIEYKKQLLELQQAHKTELESLKKTAKVEITEAGIKAQEAKLEKQHQLKLELLKLNEEKSALQQEMLKGNIENVGLRNEVLQRKLSKDSGKAEKGKSETKTSQETIEKEETIKPIEELYRPARKPAVQRYEEVEAIPSMYKWAGKIVKNGKPVSFDYAAAETAHSSGKKGEYVEPETEKNVSPLAVEWYANEDGKGKGQEGYVLKGINNNYEIRRYDLDRISNVVESGENLIESNPSVPRNALKRALRGEDISNEVQQAQNFVKKSFETDRVLNDLMSEYNYKNPQNQTPEGFIEYLKQEGVYEAVAKKKC